MGLEKIFRMHFNNNKDFKAMLYHIEMFANIQVPRNGSMRFSD